MSVYNTSAKGSGETQPWNTAEARALVARFLTEMGQDIRFESRLLDAISELGELCFEVETAQDRDNRLRDPSRKRIRDELGDLAFCCIALTLKAEVVAEGFSAQKGDITGKPRKPSGNPSELTVELFALISDFGRVAKAYLRATSYGKLPFTLGDESVRSSLLALEQSVLAVCVAAGADLNGVVADALARYRRRLANGGTLGSESDPGPVVGVDSSASYTIPFPTPLTQAGPVSAKALAEVKSFAVQLAFAGGAVVRRYFRQSLAVEEKGDHSPVTAADRETEYLLRELIRSRYPDHGIVGEEFGGERESSRFTWVIDPIDGTKSFLGGAFDFGTIIALLDQGVPMLGVIHQPITMEIVVGDNRVTTFNGRRTQMRPCTQLTDAILLATDLLTVGQFQDGPRFAELSQRVKFARTWGNCFGYALLAGGFADIMVDPIVSPWDAMAVIPVIRGAGGVITDFSGKDPVLGCSLVASGPEIHDDVISTLKRTP